MKATIKILGTSFRFLLIATILCGVIYTLLITGLAQLLFPHQANGSIIEVDGKRYGSALLAQQFTGEEYLWGRVMNLDTTSFTAENGDPAVYAWPSNLSPASEEYGVLIAARVAAIKAAHPDQAAAVPVDLVTCSGSGNDPHISPAAAEYQASRIAGTRGIEVEQVRRIIERYTEGRLLGVLGEPRVNVLKVNLALEGILKA